MPNKNTVQLTTTENNDKRSFAVTNPTSGKILFFINASTSINAEVLKDLSINDLKSIMGQCVITEFVKAKADDAMAGITL